METKHLNYSSLKDAVLPQNEAYSTTKYNVAAKKKIHRNRSNKPSLLSTGSVKNKWNSSQFV